VHIYCCKDILRAHTAADTSYIIYISEQRDPAASIVCIAHLYNSFVLWRYEHKLERYQIPRSEMLWLDRLRPRAAQEAAEDWLVSGRGAGGVPGLHRTPGRSPHPHQRAGGLPGVPLLALALAFFVYQGFTTARQEKFLALSSSAGVCVTVPKTVSGIYRFDVNGNW
jgi:hypothetical protein